MALAQLLPEPASQRNQQAHKQRPEHGPKQGEQHCPGPGGVAERAEVEPRQAGRLAQLGGHCSTAACQQQRGEHEREPLLTAELFDCRGRTQQRRTEGGTKAGSATTRSHQRDGQGGPGAHGGPTSPQRQQQSRTQGGGW